MYQQEIIADNLFINLKDYFGQFDNKLTITIEGAGVHWNCNVEMNDRKCEIHCFEFRHYEISKPEYLISFEENTINKAWGRTHEIEETLTSCKDWILQDSLDNLYKKYEFIDWYKRKILSIEAELINYEAELAKSEKILESDWGSGLYDYYIKFEDRSCKLNGYGIYEPISFEFYWDDCFLFEVKQNDIKQIACVIKKWLIDKIEPSKLESQFSWVTVGQVAKYYEKGEGIKGEFIESWNDLERFYKGINETFVPNTLKLIEVLRNHGFDKTLRAGTSLYRMILSRSRRHGLNDNQKSLCFSFYGEKMQVVNEMNTEWKFDKIEWNTRLEQLIRDLEKTEIS